MRSDQVLARTMGWSHERIMREFELGGAVEREQFIESTYKMNTLGQLLRSRESSGKNAVRTWQQRNDYIPGPDIIPAGPNPHDWDCPCDRCVDGFERLLVDLDLTAEPVVGRLKVPTRYRRDESDR